MSSVQTLLSHIQYYRRVAPCVLVIISEKFYQVQNLEFMLTCAVVRALHLPWPVLTPSPFLKKHFRKKNIIFFL